MAGVTNCTAMIALGDIMTGMRLRYCPMLRDVLHDLPDCALGGDPERQPNGNIESDRCPLVRITVRVGTPPVDVDWHPEVDRDSRRWIVTEKTLSLYELKPKRARADSGESWWYAERRGIRILVHDPRDSWAQTIEVCISSAALRRYVRYLEEKKT